MYKIVKMANTSTQNLKLVYKYKVWYGILGYNLPLDTI